MSCARVAGFRKRFIIFLQLLHAGFAASWEACYGKAVGTRKFTFLRGEFCPDIETFRYAQKPLFFFSIYSYWRHFCISA